MLIEQGFSRKKWCNMEGINNLDRIKSPDRIIWRQINLEKTISKLLECRYD